VTVTLFTVICGIIYPVVMLGVAQVAFHHQANGSLVSYNGHVVGSSLLCQEFVDAKGNPLPQYFQSRPSAAGTNGYDPTASSGSNLGPESVVDTPADPAQIKAGKSPSDAGFKAGLLTLVCSRSAAAGQLEGVDGSRPFCTGDGVGAVLSVIGPRDAGGNVIHPARVVSVNQPCATTKQPFLETYEGVKVECAKYDEDYSIGQIVPIRGAAPANPAVPADAVTESGSGLDPHISPAYADIQVARVAKTRAVSADQVRKAIHDNEDGRFLGFMGEPTVNVLLLNVELDKKYPAKS